MLSLQSLSYGSFESYAWEQTLHLKETTLRLSFAAERLMGQSKTRFWDPSSPSVRRNLCRKKFLMYESHAFVWPLHSPNPTTKKRRKLPIEWDRVSVCKSITLIVILNQKNHTYRQSIISIISFGIGNIFWSDNWCNWFI